MKVNDGDFIGFILHQCPINEKNENEKEKEKELVGVQEKEKEEKKADDYGFIAFYKNGEKVTEDIKLTEEESECDFYANGYIKGYSFANKINPPSYPPSSELLLPINLSAKETDVTFKGPLKIPLKSLSECPGEELGLMA